VKYMVLIYGDEGWLERQSEADLATHHQRWMDHSQELQDAGVVRDGAALQPTATATTVRGAGKPLVSDGPFAETREQLGGYYVIEAEDLETAIGVARRIPAARKGTVEIRPVLKFG